MRIQTGDFCGIQSTMVHRIATDTAIASAQQQVTQITIALHTLVYQAVDIRGQTTAFGHYGQRKAGIRLHRIPLAIRPAPITQPTVSRTQYVTTPDDLLPYRQTRFEQSGISLPRPLLPLANRAVQRLPVRLHGHKYREIAFPAFFAKIHLQPTVRSG